MRLPYHVTARLMALLAMGCEGDAGPMAPPTPPGPAPTFVERVCEGSIPGGIAAVCGSVQVPERRDDPTSAAVAVRVAVLRARDGDPRAPRVAYLAGPAGGSGVASALYYSGWSLDGSLRALLARRTLVAIDLRGSGASSPSLRCPGVRLPALPEGAALDAETEAAVRDCRERLTDERVAPEAYGTGAAADDVEAVRRALGGDRWDLVGSAYGARVALEVVRRHPDGVRALVLDSVLPPEVDLLAEEAPSAARALQAMADDCAGDGACQSVFPDPLGVLTELMGRLDAEPVDVATHGGSVQLDGTALARAVLQQLQEPGGARLLPRRLYEAQAGRLDFFAAVLGAPRGEGSLGAHLSVMCGEALPLSGPGAIERRAAGLLAAARRALLGRAYPKVCPLWGVPAAPAALRAPVRGSLPVLLLAGRHDPVSPPAWSRAVAAGFSAAKTVELPDQGHALLRAPCGAALAAAFLDDPLAPPVASCAAGGLADSPGAGVP
jgi:pimeloyl-ACP methyl ester carboxylesterase